MLLDPRIDGVLCALEELGRENDARVAERSRKMLNLERDCLLLADNALSHPEEIAGYIAAVDALPDFATTIFPVGKGLHVACRS